MINRRGMLKMLGLAPVVAPAVVAGLSSGAAASGLAMPPERAVDLGRLVWSRSINIVSGEYLYDPRENPAALMAQISGNPVNEAMRAYCDEIVDVPPPAFAIVTAPYHPELTVHA